MVDIGASWLHSPPEKTATGAAPADTMRRRRRVAIILLLAAAGVTVGVYGCWFKDSPASRSSRSPPNKPGKRLPSKWVHPSVAARRPDSQQQQHYYHRKGTKRKRRAVADSSIISSSSSSRQALTQQEERLDQPRLKLAASQLLRRRLADKYHPDKANFSCTLYFANGTSTTITAPRPGSNSTPTTSSQPVAQARDGYGYGGYNNDNDEELPPPCRFDGNNVILPPVEGEGGGPPPQDAGSDGENESVSVAGLRPIGDEQEDEAPSEEEESVVGNIVRTKVSVALPPDPYGRGIPRSVAKAVTNLFNITSNLRSEEMSDFLNVYKGTKDDLILNELVDLYADDLTQNDIPDIISSDQTVLFFLRYQKDFQRQQASHALFWEMVHKDTHADPIYRSESPDHRPLYSTSLPSGSSEGYGLEEHHELSNLQLGHWWSHTVAFRCYRRDQDGQVQPLFDTVTLDIIQQQIDLWMEFHVNVTRQLLESLQRKQVIGVAMPGEEHDVFIASDAWTPKPPQEEGQVMQYDDDASIGEATGNSGPRQGTYKEPLLTTESYLLDTTRQLVGLSVLVVTIAVTFLWTMLSYIYRARQQEQAVWGTAMGTEQALQDLLSVGWRIHDQTEGGEDSPRQVLEIYNKTKDGMGYRDDDSLLQGEVTAPMNSGTGS